MYVYGGSSNIGYGREYNEDFIQLVELDKNNILAIIADGVGSNGQSMQPAAIVANEITLLVKEFFSTDKDMFLSKTDTILHFILSCANRVLGGFKMGSDELYGGYASAVTCCLLDENQKMTFAHSGNTRLYLLRDNNKKDVPPALRQLTKDHTDAMRLVDIGEINIEEYHTHPGRMNLYSGMGVVTNPVIQTFSMPLKNNDILLLTTDGVHCAVRPDVMAQFILESDSCEAASQTLITGAQTVKYVDNMSTIIIWNIEDEANA